MRAAGPPQRAAEERGAGMPRRRRNLASVMANRRPQREAVERGKAPETNTLVCWKSLLGSWLSSRSVCFMRAICPTGSLCFCSKHRLPVGQMSLIMSLHVHHTKMNFNIKLRLFPQFLLSIYNVSHYLISPPFFLFPLLLIKCKTHSKGAVYT